ncbi:hypothetical protein FB45DRAFT_859832 [Roridomyces roridus]|uniref:Uncharacterized protein n=1 Tax=Roridomyces roridus TaxID=1738132 RepID=A0AAD7CKS1_9AGAR|nr:hypothetical protein FB45DRAFT_859832 [Roridomyces roridus]
MTLSNSATEGTKNGRNWRQNLDVNSSSQSLVFGFVSVAAISPPLRRSTTWEAVGLSGVCCPQSSINAIDRPMRVFRSMRECTPDCWKGIGPNSEPFDWGQIFFVKVLVSVLLAQILNIEESMLGDSGWLWFG